MVAFIVILGIVVLASLIVLAATVMAGRADESSEKFPPRPQAQTLTHPNHEKKGRAPNDPAAAGISFMTSDDDAAPR